MTSKTGTAPSTSFDEAQQKTITDTVNKQRRLIELYQMKHYTSGDITSQQCADLVVSSQGIVDLIMNDQAAHAHKTVRAAMNLSGFIMAIQKIGQDIAEKENATAKAAKAKKPASKKPAKAAAKK